MKKIVSMLLTVLLVCLCLTGCAVEVNEPESQEGIVYYYYGLSNDEIELERDVYTPSEETCDVMVKELLQFFSRKNASGETSNLLPEEVTINSFELKDNILILDFNSKYSSMSRSREALVRLGIVKTFMQVPNILGVRFTVEGADLVNSKNEVIGKMTEDTFLELSDEFDTYRYDTFTLYFTDKEGKHLIEEKRSVYYKRTLQKERVILEQLAKGPMVKGNYPTISENTDVLDITIADRVCYVDVNKSFLESVLEVSPEIALYSVVNSLMAENEIEKVQILVNGKSDSLLGEMSLYGFYTINKDFVKKGE